jgi:N-acetyl-anhydromuramyl-L-alanine amidase AmpD
MIWDLFARTIEKLRTGPLQPLDLPGAAFHDRRKTASQSHHGYKTRARPISRITGITLHQTGCVKGERPERYDGGGAHVFVTRRGVVIWLHDWDRRVVAANGLNDFSVSIEFDGLLYGIEGDERTVWDNPATLAKEQGMPLTEEQIAAGRDVVRWIADDVARRGGYVERLRAHREASASRRSDPGQAVWRDVALPMAEELGIQAGGTPVGDGLPIPREWDPTSGHRY